MKRITCFAICAAVVSSMLPAMTASAVMTVGSMPEGWNISRSGGSKGYAAVTDEKAHTGENSMLLYCESPGWVANRYTQVFRTVSVQEGKTYEFGCWAKGTKVHSSSIKIEWESPVSLQPFESYDWREFKGTYTAKTTGNVTYQINMDEDVGKLYIDDLFMYEIDEEGNRVGDNLITKTGFESDDSDVVISTAGMSEAEKKRMELWENEVSSKQDFDEIAVILDKLPIFKRITPNQSNWASFNISLPQEKLPNTIKDYAGPEDNSLGFKVEYDDNNFYLHAERIDDIEVDKLDDTATTEIEHQVMVIGPGGQFKPKLNYVDSIQFALSDGEKIYEFGAQAMNNAKLECFIGDMPEEDLNKINLSVNKLKTKTTFDIAIPWDILGESFKNRLFFDIMSNDKDEGDKFGHIQWGGGMTLRIDQSKMKEVSFRENSDAYQIVEETTDEREATRELKYKYYFVNTMANKKDISLNLPDGSKKKISVPGNSVYFTYAPVTFNKKGDYEIKFSAEELDGTLIAEDTLSVSVDDKYLLLDEYTRRMDVLKNEKLPAVKALRDELNAVGIETDYEDMSLAVIERQIEYQYDDILYKEMDMLKYNIPAIERMCENAEAALLAYKSGEKVPLDAPEFKTSLVTRQGMTYYAQDKEGKIRPTYFVGYGHFAEADRDIPNFNSFGANFIQREIPLQDVVKIVNGEVTIDYAYINVFDNMIKGAVDSNVQFDLLLPQHYIDIIPGIGEIFPDVNSWHSPDRRMILKKFYEAVLPVMIKHSSLHSFCISNEPGVRLKNNQYDLEFYRNFLKERYNGDITALNENYKSEYKSFDEIMIPEKWYTDSWNAFDNPAGFEPGELNRAVDWFEANNKTFMEYHKWMGDTIRSIAGNIPIHSKTQASLLSEDIDWARNYMMVGVDYQDFGDYYDLNGNDACNFPGRGEEILDKLAWYDYLTSVNRVPVYNSEDHITLDNDKTYNEKYAPHFYTDMWQGALHGRSASAIWLWQRSHTDTTVMGNVLSRPDAVEMVGKACMDLNRLGYEVSQFANDYPELAIYYDPSARLQNSRLLNVLHKAYAANTYLGKRTAFVGDVAARAHKLDDYKAVIIPDTNNMEKDVLERFCDYIKKGGKVIILGADSLKYQRYDTQPADESLRSFLFENSIVLPVTYSEANVTDLVYPTENDLVQEFFNIYDNMGFLEVKVTDLDTGKPAHGVDVMEVGYNGKRLINLCNYIDDTVKNISIELNGKKVTKAVNRLTETEIDCTSLSLKTNEPILILVEE